MGGDDDEDGDKVSGDGEGGDGEVVDEVVVDGDAVVGDGVGVGDGTSGGNQQQFMMVPLEVTNGTVSLPPNAVCCSSTCRLTSCRNDQSCCTAQVWFNALT